MVSDYNKCVLILTILYIYFHAIYLTIGYIEAAERLQKEAGIVCDKFEVADNLDLGLILNEYESYYELKFDKKLVSISKIVNKALFTNYNITIYIFLCCHIT